MRLILFLLLLTQSSCWMLRAYKVRNMQLTDHWKLPYVYIQRPDSAAFFTDANGRAPYTALADYLDTQLLRTQTAAFLVIRNDSILYERYYNGFDGCSLLPSNSMAKSFTGTLAAIALEEGAIKSLKDPITRYLPELLESDTAFARITVEHLLNMRSGIKFNEGSYNLKDDAVRLGFRPNLKKHLLKAHIAEAPGNFKYQSINTQLLALIIERATGESLATYLQEKLWVPIGAESCATWNVDSRKRKFTLASAGLNATARDFAKLGRLYINNGKGINGSVISESWVNNVRQTDTMVAYGGYKNQWWSRAASRTFKDSVAAAGFQARTPYALPVRKVQNGYRVNYRTGAFNASGFLNQALYVHPEKKVIIVRLGRRWRHNDNILQFIYNLGEQL